MPVSTLKLNKVFRDVKMKLSYGQCLLVHKTDVFTEWQ